jgi:hypothetical protein
MNPINITELIAAISYLIGLALLVGLIVYLVTGGNL